MRCLLLFVVLAAALPAQLGLGLKVGVPFEDRSTPLRALEGGRFLGGPTLELRLPAGLSVEGAALYSTYRTVPGGSAGPLGIDYRRFEFPVVGKLRFGGSLIRPYALAGPVFGIAWPDNGPSFSRTGFALGGGLELRAPLVRVSPEFRYVRNRPGSLSDNAAQVLLGVSF